MKPPSTTPRLMLLRAWRVGVLMVIGLLLYQHRAALRARVDDPLTAREVRAILPAAAGLGLSKTDGGHLVLDATGTLIGHAYRSAPWTDGVVGYVGPSDVLIVVGVDGRLAGVRLRSSRDTPGHVADVAGDAAFWAAWDGRPAAEVASLDLDAAGFDGVSGATRTSRCAAEGLVQRLRSIQGQEVAAARIEWGLHDLLLVATVGVAVALGLLAPARRRRWRLPLQVFVVGYLGFVAADLLAQSLLAGWVVEGIPWRARPGMVFLAAAAVVLPWHWGQPVYCARVCPHGVLQQWMGRAGRRLPRLQLAPEVRRAFRAVPVLLLALVLATVALELPADLAQVEAFDAYLVGAAGVVSIAVAVGGLALAAVSPMAYCRYGCPTGALLAFVRVGGADRFGWRDAVGAAFLVLTVVLTQGHDAVRGWIAGVPWL